ncbi:Crossover junction endonuclease mus81 [Kappamyces sp. JEL0829]|nr:Crossover junction endonuclease mus81 [Kappamyces sp. JEL0829]
MVYSYRKALKALRDYPLVLESGSEGRKSLNGIGEKLERILNELNRRGDGSPRTHSDPPSGSVLSLDQPASASQASGIASSRQASKPQGRKKPYRPGARSGGYGILVALYRHAGHGSFLDKAAIVQHAQLYCSSSFTVPSKGSGHSNYTAWNSMAKLLEEELVISTGNPKRYSLTDDGAELAKKFSDAEKRNGSGPTITLERELLDQPDDSDSDLNSVISRQTSEADVAYDEMERLPASSQDRVARFRSRPWQPLETRSFQHTVRDLKFNPVALPKSASDPTPVSSLPEFMNELPYNPFYHEIAKREREKTDEALAAFSGSTRLLPAGSFEILLLLDNREVRARRDRDFFQQQLESKGIKCLTQTLELGDVCWVARNRADHNDLVLLDWIVERKTKDDLIASIQDGRFKEQKHRLSRCGISNIVYLVEEFDSSGSRGDSLASALTETQILHGFFVQQTTNAQDTVDYLAKITKYLVSQHENRDIRVLHGNDIHPDTHHLLRKHLNGLDNTPCLVSLSNFAALTSKTKQLTHFDIWIKQLLSIRGVSAEKALVLSKHYKSLADFTRKMRVLPSAEQRIQAIMGCGENHSRRKIGKALSRHVLECLYE